MKTQSRYFFLTTLSIFSVMSIAFAQSITIDGADIGRTFDGVGGVSGGGATSVLLMSYPEPQRSQILDYLFKPNFGASLQTHFCEIPGDCNATQGSELSHMHTRTDENYQRGYEWFIMKEAFRRNPAVTFDAVAWGCPYWVGNNNFWSTDMQDYYIKWIKGLKDNYGISLDAIGCRNESGSNTSWLIQFHNALNAANCSNVRVHGMDDWNGVQAKWGVADQLAGNANLREAIDVLSAHTTINTSWSELQTDATASALNSGKPLWDTEEHYMDQNSGYNQLTAEVEAFNLNYIRSKVTKTIFWYLVDGTYPTESWNDYGCMNVKQPWSGYYEVKPGLWGYAHYSQFVKVGWKFIDAACGTLNSGGSYVTLKSPDNTDFSVIIETRNAKADQTVNFTVTGGLPTAKKLCVWRSNTASQFVMQADITPSDGAFSITVDANSVYSISTTTGQQKGSYTPPASGDFPFPYYENFDHYSDARLWGYVPYYFADICGAFEITECPDENGKCLRQVLDKKAQSWAPEWAPFTIIGDKDWTNYEVSADIHFDNGGWAGVMGRINNTMSGYGAFPRGYLLRLASTGAWALYWSAAARGSLGEQLANGTVELSGSWHNVKLQCDGTTITGLIDNVQVTSVTNSNAGNGMIAFVTGDVNNNRNTALFDNLIINTVNGSTPQPTVFTQDVNPPYKPNQVIINKPPQRMNIESNVSAKTIVGGRVLAPATPHGKKMECLVYTLKGELLEKRKISNGEVIKLTDNHYQSKKVLVVQFKPLK